MALKRATGRPITGSVYQRSDGRWVAQLMRNGHRVQKIAPTREAAEVLRQGLLEPAKAGERVNELWVSVAAEAQRVGDRHLLVALSRFAIALRGVNDAA
jgi:hypothetical protein